MTIYQWSDYDDNVEIQLHKYTWAWGHMYKGMMEIDTVNWNYYDRHLAKKQAIDYYYNVTLTKTVTGGRSWETMTVDT